MIEEQKLYLLRENVVKTLICKSYSNSSIDGELFIVEKYDIHKTTEPEERIAVVLSRTLVHCWLNQIGGSNEINSRLPARTMNEDEKYLYAMRASWIMEGEKWQDMKRIFIHNLNFKDLIERRTITKKLIWDVKTLIWRLLLEVPRARFQALDIFISTKYDLGRIEMQLDSLLRDGYIKSLADQGVYGKDSAGFKILEEDIEGKTFRLSKSDIEEKDFNFVINNELKKIIERDWIELQKVRNSGASKATLIISGSIIETLLLDALLRYENKAKSCLKAPAKKKELREWDLNDLIEVCSELKIISSDSLNRFSHGVRNYRNLVHPGKELREKTKFREAEGDIAFNVVKIVIDDLIEFYEKSKGAI